MSGAEQRPRRPEDGPEQAQHGPDRTWRTRPQLRAFRPDGILGNHRLGKEAKLSYSGHVLMENRNGLVVDLRIEQATGTAEWDAGLAMADEHLAGRPGRTLGADKAYDVQRFVTGCREQGIVPHVAHHENRRCGSRIDRRTTRRVGYEISQRLRKRVEEIFGWAKTVACFRRTRFRGRARTQLAAHLVAAAYNLLRMSKLIPA